MKNIIIFILAAILSLSLCACSGEEIPKDNTSDLLPPVSENSEAEIPAEPEKDTEKSPETEEEKPSMTFKLGLGGETTELSPGDTIGDWTLEDLEVDSDTTDTVTPIDYVRAEFSGDITLEGYIERNRMLEHGYDFIVSEHDLVKLPFIVADYISDRGHFLLSIPDGLEIYPELDFNESLHCKITVSGCSRVLAYTEAVDGLEVVKIELEDAAGLSYLYRDILIDFGGKVREGVLGVAKGLSLYYSDGCEDFSKISAGTAYSFAIIHSYSDNYIEVSLPGFRDKVFAFPENYFEDLLMKYFDLTVEYLRSFDFYYPEQHCYFLDGHVGMGEVPDLIINSIEENGDTVIFHITLDCEYGEDENMMLKVRIDQNGSYKYLSYLPE